MIRTAAISCLRTDQPALPVADIAALDTASVPLPVSLPVPVPSDPTGPHRRTLFAYNGLLIHLIDAPDPQHGEQGRHNPPADRRAGVAALLERYADPYREDGLSGTGGTAATAHEFYRYEARPGHRGTHRALIVARIDPDAEKLVADIFDESDAGELPGLIGVRTRSLLRSGTLYLHYIDADQPVGAAVARYRDHAAYADVNSRLAARITPFDPATWRSPADAMATEIYHWSR